MGVSPMVLVWVVLLAMGGAKATSIAVTRVVTITGQICCTPSGNCPGTPVVGAAVTLTCSGTIITPGVITNTTTSSGDGTYTVSATITTNFIIAAVNIVPCLITVQLPIATCPALSNTGGGRLIGPIVPTGASTGTVPFFIRFPV
ncbi:hypothetical protein SASPL_109918 [Salvia splendens]|uniref:Uncharacterized protein n=1 Tax=Salvia splendens TaxID=180675 RepID=A0A8X9A814_SALSN|nr:hypothetical protein SASPL_109918 [Salvia splendens]